MLLLDKNKSKFKEKRGRERERVLLCSPVSFIFIHIVQCTFILYFVSVRCMCVSLYLKKICYIFFCFIKNGCVRTSVYLQSYRSSKPSIPCPSIFGDNNNDFDEDDNDDDDDDDDGNDDEENICIIKFWY